MCRLVHLIHQDRHFHLLLPDQEPGVGEFFLLGRGLLVAPEARFARMRFTNVDCEKFDGIAFEVSANIFDGLDRAPVGRSCHRPEFQHQVLFADVISQTDVLAVSCLQDKIGDLVAQEGPRLELLVDLLVDTAQLELEHPEDVGVDNRSPGLRRNPIVVLLWRHDTFLA
ncbi:MAG: hypothetical protein V3R40_00610 [Gammaproteobacteria bacterium]